MKLQVLANNQQTFSLSGTHFRILESNQAVYVTFEGGNISQKVKLERGMSFTPQGGFTGIRIDSPVDQDIEVQNTFGELLDNRISGVIEVNNNPNNALIGLIPVTFDVNAKTISGNASRKELHIQSAASNTGLIYLGSTSRFAGIPIEPGQTVVLEISNDLDLYADTVNSVVNLCEVV